MPRNRTVGRLQLEAALANELGEPISLLPSRSIEEALKDDVERAAAFISARISSGISATATEVVVAAKSSRGFRPVHVLDIEQRALYRALVDLLGPRITYPDRSDEAYERFKRGPLSVDGATHVVRADVASFYQYIDHRVLQSEIVSQTGEAEVAGSIIDAVGPIMGRAFGLPQNSGASHALADVYIDKVERQLIRFGESVWRYNDDFAMAASGLRQARRALEDLERSLRAVGLTPNDEKSLIHRREAYEGWVERPLQFRAQMATDLAVDLDAWIILAPATEYEEEVEAEVGEPEGEDGEEAQALAAEHESHVAGAVRTLEAWLEHVRSENRSDPLERYVYRTLARDAIRVLRRRLSSEGIAFCDSLLAFEPQMTHTVCRYLSRLARVDDAPLDFVGKLVGRAEVHLSPWQTLWLLEPLLWAWTLPPDLRNWVTAILDDHSSPLLRARAALVLATHERVSTTRLGILFDESTSAAKPDLVVAMARASANQATVRAMANENELFRLVAAHAQEDF